MHSSLIVAVAWVTVGCGSPVPDAGPGGGRVVVSFEPGAELSAVSSVVRLHVASSSLRPGDASLFQGSLSDYYLSKVKHGDLPDTLAAREVPVMSWRRDAELVVAPVLPLDPGPYSLAAATGLLSEFQVSSRAPYLRRVWPPTGAPGSARFVVYCADGEPPGGGALALQPGALMVELASGVDEQAALSERCLHFSTASELATSQLVLPEPQLGIWAVDPSAFAASAESPSIPLACAPGEARLGLGCAAPADDRVVVRTPAGALLWIVHSAQGASAEVTRGGASFVIRGLSPATHQRLWGSVHDSSGSEVSFDGFVDTTPARARPVLNEVLADALGPEPQSEWLELVNDGSLSLDLSGYSLRDSGGITPLPAEVLEPDEYALLVRNDFATNASDVPPAAGARLIRVPALGKSGLSNAGERLALLDLAGEECSVIPAFAAKPGQSLARRHPWSLDGDPDAFSLGVPTPGAVNADK